MSGRLAPTPSGHLHLGNALAFGAAYLSTRAAKKPLLFRLEDLDRGRARSTIAQAQQDDLRWLGITWDETTPPQSSRCYDLEAIPTFACACTRARRQAGGCSCRSDADPSGSPGAARTLRFVGARETVTFEDRARGPQRFSPTEDPVLLRATGEVGYPAAVVIDDLRDGVSEVVRGADLLEPTAVQIQIHAALGARPPTYLHTPLLLDMEGQKLAKRHGSLELRALREAGETPAMIWRRLLPLLGLRDLASLDAAISHFDPLAILPGPFLVDAGGQIREASP